MKRAKSFMVSKNAKKKDGFTALGPLKDGDLITIKERKMS